MSDDAIRVSLADSGSVARRLGPSVGPPVASSGSAFTPSGSLVARYRVIEELGRGQMGVVYRAVQTALDREVAIKFPTVESAVGGERFLREARTLARLSHQNLVRVIDADLDGGRPFLVLEFVMGWSLMEYRERRETLPVAEAVGLVCQVLDGLAVAHAAGIVHRDIKSGNVLVSSDGVAKLADFGLARGPDAAALTQSGTLLGTPAYLAPEVAQGKPGGVAADLYAAGVMLFELITGRLPFTALSPGDIFAKHIRDAPPKLARYASDIPDGIEHAYQALLAKAPEDRPAGALEAGRMLRRAMGLSESVSALAIPALPPEMAQAAVAQAAARPMRPASRPTRRVLAPARDRTWVWAAGGFALALGVAAPAAWFLTRRPVPGPVVSATPAPLPSAVIEAFPGAAARAGQWTLLVRRPPEPSGLVCWTSMTDGAQMVRVPAGPCVRGCDEAGPDEKPPRRIHVDEFWIDRFEVTNRLYDRFVAATGHAPRERHAGRVAALDGPDNPVVSVTWQDAVDYGTWAGKRLPTEAEWEKAARGPDGHRYPWGDDEPSAKNCNMADPMNVANDGYELTSPAGRFPDGASCYGAQDMAGNVWEWCSDWYGERYYRTSPDRSPTGAPDGRWRVSRGGSYVSYEPADLLGCYRKKGEPTARHLDQGFRCARPGPL